MQTTTINLTLKFVAGVAIATALLLLVPLLAMRFTDEVNWTALDFTVAGALLFGAGLAFVLLTRKAPRSAYRLAAAITMGTALMLVWGNLAVGLIGSEHNPANLMYAGVIAVEIIGVFLARFAPSAMSRALFATAATQALCRSPACGCGRSSRRQQRARR